MVDLCELVYENHCPTLSSRGPHVLSPGSVEQYWFEAQRMERANKTRRDEAIASPY